MDGGYGGDAPLFPGVNAQGIPIAFGPVSGPYAHPGAPPNEGSGTTTPEWCAGGGGSRGITQNYGLDGGKGGDAMIIVEWWYMP